MSSRKTLRSIFLLMILLLYRPAEVCAGWLISGEVKDNFGNLTLQSTFVEGSLVRMETPTTLTIFDTENCIITMVFSGQRAYWTGTMEDYQREILEAYDAQVESVIRSLPLNEQDHYRALYDSVTSFVRDEKEGLPENNLQFIQDGDPVVLNGYRCFPYSLSLDSTVIEQLWWSDSLQPYAGLDQGCLLDMAARVRTLDHFPGIIRVNAFRDLFGRGLVVQSRSMAGQGSWEYNVTGIRAVRVPDEFFVPPSSYQKVSLSMVFELPVVDPAEADSPVE